MLCGRAVTPVREGLLTLVLGDIRPPIGSLAMRGGGSMRAPRRVRGCRHMRNLVEEVLDAFVRGPVRDPLRVAFTLVHLGHARVREVATVLEEAVAIAREFPTYWALFLRTRVFKLSLPLLVRLMPIVVVHHRAALTRRG